MALRSTVAAQVPRQAVAAMAVAVQSSDPSHPEALRPNPSDTRRMVHPRQMRKVAAPRIPMAGAGWSKTKARVKAAKELQDGREVGRIDIMRRTLSSKAHESISSRDMDFCIE